MADYAREVERRLSAAFEPHRDPAAAMAMAKYMRDRYPFLGIKSPRARALQREALGGLPAPGEDELAAAVMLLWDKPEREYQYAACGLIARHVRQCGPTFLPTLGSLITTRSWWDTVDDLASHAVGALVSRFPGLAMTMDTWIESDDFWLARVALIHQLRFKTKTDVPRLFHYCLRCADEREFFLRKAAGWALREYSKTDGPAVLAFVAAHEAELSPLTRREALLWLNGGRSKAGSALNASLGAAAEG